MCVCVVEEYCGCKQPNSQGCTSWKRVFILDYASPSYAGLNKNLIRFVEYSYGRNSLVSQKKNMP